jgi:hypothetical protein
MFPLLKKSLFCHRVFLLNAKLLNPVVAASKWKPVPATIPVGILGEWDGDHREMKGREHPHRY